MVDPTEVQMAMAVTMAVPKLCLLFLLKFCSYTVNVFLVQYPPVC